MCLSVTWSRTKFEKVCKYCDTKIQKFYSLIQKFFQQLQSEQEQAEDNAKSEAEKSETSEESQAPESQESDLGSSGEDMSNVSESPVAQNQPELDPGEDFKEELGQDQIEKEFDEKYGDGNYVY